MAEKQATISFVQKKAVHCPVCNAEIYREEMLSGRGRMIAGKLTPELHRLYEPSQKYGEIYPIIYPVTTCPQCYYSAWREDFAKIPQESLKRAKDEGEKRVKWIQELITEPLDFTEKRNPITGLCSYILAVLCYDYHNIELSPLIKQGISSLRAAWLARVLHNKAPEENYNYLAKMLYRKSRFFYSAAIDGENTGKQSMAGCPNLGPDLDKNYGFDGALYMYGYLELYHGPRRDRLTREKNVMKAKQIVARIFGMGKATKEKPTAILDNARDLHDKLSEELGNLKNSG